MYVNKIEVIFTALRVPSLKNTYNTTELTITEFNTIKKIIVSLKK